MSSTAFGDYPFRTRERQYGWQNDFALPHGTATLAVERREERIDDDAGFAVTRRDTNAVVGILQFVAERRTRCRRISATTIDPVRRADDRRDRVGLSHRAAAGGSTASYGTAFKAPSFNDLYYPGFSNPDLEPETARNVEGSVHWSGQLGAWRIGARAVAWYNQVRRADRVPVRRRVQLRAHATSTARRSRA